MTDSERRWTIWVRDGQLSTPAAAAPSDTSGWEQVAVVPEPRALEVEQDRAAFASAAMIQQERAEAAERQLAQARAALREIVSILSGDPAADPVLIREKLAVVACEAVERINPALDDL